MPLIGITTYSKNDAESYYLPGQYVEAVRNAGGVPVLLPSGESQVNQILRVVDGLLFAGGGDIDPAVYGGSSHPTISRVDRVRDNFEIALATNIMNMAIPVLGICRGFQILTITTGGKLVAHIPDEYGGKIIHKAENGKSVKHPVRVMPDSRLAKIIGGHELQVESMHHQAAHTVTAEWRIAGNSEDGVIEAIEHKKHPWMIAVLWHPEISLKDSHNQKIFRAFVHAAGGKNNR
jgi:putative glutamine amidotransferase